MQDCKVLWNGIYLVDGEERVYFHLIRIKFFDFSDRDVVRHPVVQRIVMAYDRADKEREKQDKV